MTWNDLITPDPAASAKFYGDLFGWTTEEMEGGQGYRVISNGERSNGGMMPIDRRWADAAELDAVLRPRGRRAAGRRDRRPRRPGRSTGRCSCRTGTIAVLGDPQGAAFAVWTGRLRRLMELLETWQRAAGRRRSRTTRASPCCSTAASTSSDAAGAVRRARLGRLVGQRRVRLPPLPLDLARGAGGDRGPARRSSSAGPRARRSRSPRATCSCCPRAPATAAPASDGGFTVVGAYPRGPGGLRPAARGRRRRARADRRTCRPPPQDPVGGEGVARWSPCGAEAPRWWTVRPGAEPQADDLPVPVLRRAAAGAERARAGLSPR